MRGTSASLFLLTTLVLLGLLVLRGPGLPATVARAEDEPSLLQSHDVPPAGVEAQFDSFAPASGATCIFNALQPGNDRRLDHPVQVLDTLIVCLDGFAPHEPIGVQVGWPAGQTTNLGQVVTNEAGNASFDWTIEAGFPRGAYVLTMTQGPRQALSHFVVVTAGSPRQAILPAAGPPGTTFQVQLAGFRPGEEAHLLLYQLTKPCPNRPPESAFLPCFVYLTNIATNVDQDGEASIGLRTQAADPVGNYRVLFSVAETAPSKVAGDSFSLTSPRARPDFAPLAPKADLVVDDLNIAGRRPDGADDCDPGRNQVTVIIRNAGSASAPQFSVQLLVDGNEAADDGVEVPLLGPGEETSITFPRIKLKRGLHQLRVIADADSDIAERSEANNLFSTSATCQHD